MINKIQQNIQRVEMRGVNLITVLVFVSKSAMDKQK